MRTTKLTQERLKQLLEYDAACGVFRWRKSRGCRKAGTIAGARQGWGYIHIRLDGELFMSHRLVWLYLYGRWPSAEIDHIDRNRSNNARSNLREATRQQNHWNVGAQSNNKLGLKGVRLHRGRYEAKIRTPSGELFLGSFTDPEEAAAAYRAAAAVHFGAFSGV